MLAVLLLTLAQNTAHTITFDSLVKEMGDRDALARFPVPPYRALRATSYNRESVAKDKPGWFADSDGAGFLREETNAGRHEWVIQEQLGPGCLTKFWTPYFYYDLNDHVGPTVRIYLDGASEPLLAMPLIELVTGNAWPENYGPKPPRESSLEVWTCGGFTARAGTFDLPIPFGRGCKVTLDKRPFYYSVDSRSYASGTALRTVQSKELVAELERRAKEFANSWPGSWHGPPRPVQMRSALEPGQDAHVQFDGPRVLTAIDVELDSSGVAAHPELLRQLVLRATFDGELCVWCPVGDLFGGPHALQGFHTRTRRSDSTGRLRESDGKLHLAWPMPFREVARVELVNLGSVPARAKLEVSALANEWDARSMHFHASWRPDDVVAGDHFEDWNFIDITGEGVLVGDQWTVLNLTDGWWGEGDEKIYVDDSVERGFPDHFGTGTEDYYGWAGGVNPTKADVFSQPLLANISVGSTDHNSTRGFNVLARDRALDAIPFRKRLVFDMEASPGTEQRNPWNLLGYSSVVFWYAKPGAMSNRGADPEAAKRPLMSLEALEARSRELEKLAKQPR